LDLIRRIDATQWWSADRIVAAQLQQASTLVAFAAAQVPFHAARLREAGIEPGQRLDMDAFRRIPLLTRKDLQTGEVVAKKIPRSHGKISTNTTSGSSGMPVSVNVTQHYGRFYRALCARDNHWAARDPAWRAAVIRRPKKELPPGGAKSFGWSLGRGWAPKLSPVSAQSIALRVDQQVEWLAAQDPELLISYPSNLGALAQHCEQEGIALPSLKQVSSVGEMLTPNTIDAVRSAWGMDVVDLYSSEEVGYIASPCPDGDGYHVHSESVLVEVLDDEGQPCAAGQEGRIVITGLQNLATPLLRYEIRDWAEVGAPCGCGRGLPVIKRIVGRSRNMLQLPDGGRRWPMGGYMRFREVLPIRQYQYAQTGVDSIEIRLVPERKATAEDEAKMTEIIQESFGYPFKLNFVYLDEIPTKANGKFEEFVSEIEDQQPT
jgi:phenylacetate-CoA ligase